MLTLSQSFVILSKNIIQKDPGVIIGPITDVLGVILNAIFNFAYQFTASNSFGISIILFTLIMRLFMLPLAVHQQKSMMKMQKLQPEMAKIKKKYEGRNDPETTQRMNAEMQKLYADNKYNPLSGCLPLFIQMPIFFALSYIMQQSYRFIDVLGNLYYKATDSIAQTIISTGSDVFMGPLTPLALPKLPKGMQLDMVNPEHLAKVINRFSATDWTQLLAAMPPDVQATLTGLLAQKAQIERFFGIDLIEHSMTLSGGLGNIVSHMWPGVLIPIFAAATTFLSSYLMTAQNKAADQAAKTQQQMMLIVMPIVMGFMTASFPAGVGLYWITLNLTQALQQVVLYKYFTNKEEKAALEKNAEKASAKSDGK